nr:hypothetical protein BCACJCBH_00018 [White spot syndrome virus]
MAEAAPRYRQVLEEVLENIEPYMSFLDVFTERELALLNDIITSRNSPPVPSSSFKKLDNKEEFRDIIYFFINNNTKSDSSPICEGMTFINALTTVCKTFRGLYENIHDDFLFVKYSLLVSMDNGFLRRETHGIKFGTGDDSRTGFKFTSKEQAEEEREKVMRRIKKLDGVLASLKKSTSSARSGIVFYVEKCSSVIRFRLFSRIVNITSDYVAEMKKSAPLEPFDISFGYKYFVDESPCVTKAKRLISNGNFIIGRPFSCLETSPSSVSTDFREEMNMDARSIARLNWTNEERASAYRSVIIKSFLSSIEEEMVEEYCETTTKTVAEMAVEFVDVFIEKAETIQHFQTLYSIFDTMPKFSAEMMDNILKNVAINEAVGSGLCGAILLWMINSRPFEEIDYNYFKICLREIMVRKKTDKLCDNLIVKRIVSHKNVVITDPHEVKGYVRLCVKVSCFMEDLEAFLTKNPWLKHTYFDEKGNTLLCYCIINKYSHTSKLVKQEKLNILKPSAKGMSPLMVCAAISSPFTTRVGIEILTTNSLAFSFINENNENVFHAAAVATSCNFLDALAKKYKNIIYDFDRSIVNARRASDGATPLMIAIANHKHDVSDALVGAHGAKINMLYGKSSTLSVTEAALLMFNDTALTQFAQRGYEPSIPTILKAALDFSLQEEEPLVAATGLDVNKAPRSWPILNCRLGYIASSNYPWAEHIISGDKEEIKRALEEHEKNANVRFDSDNCPVCLEDFSSTNIIRTTRCGHCIDEKCWDRLVLSTQRGEITRCPVCRERTSLRPDADQVKEMLVEPIVSCKRMAVSDEQVSCKRRRIGYNRYQFLINDVWTDESETV